MDTNLLRKWLLQNLAKAINAKTDISFEIPIKPYEVSPQSNLNVFFGKGRESKTVLSNHAIGTKVELIIAKNVTSQPGYPQSQTDNAVFTVITDDGWSFDVRSAVITAKISVRRRFENSWEMAERALGKRRCTGRRNPVTADTLRRYGRNSFALTKTTIPGIWFLDFGVGQ